MHKLYVPRLFLQFLFTTKTVKITDIHPLFFPVQQSSLQCLYFSFLIFTTNKNNSGFSCYPTALLQEEALFPPIDSRPYPVLSAIISQLFPPRKIIFKSVTVKIRLQRWKLVIIPRSAIITISVGSLGTKIYVK